MPTQNHSDPIAPPPIPARIWKIAAVTGAGAFIAMLDSTVANLAIESIRDDLNSTLPVIQWVATGYLIALAVSLPATGWLGNRYGHGRIWSVSLAIFTLGSSFCAIAPGPLDWKGLILIGLGLPLFLYGATEIGSNKTNLFTFLVVGMSIVLAISFVFSSIKIKNPLIDLSLLKRGNFSAAASIIGLTGANMYGGLLLLPLYLQLTAGQDVLETGFMLLAMGLGTAVALYFGGMLTDYYSADPVTVAGSILLAITTVPFMFVAKFSLTMLVFLLVIRGIGLALAQMPAYTAAYTSVTDDQMGDAATVVNIAQRIGRDIGAAGLVIIHAQLRGRDSLG